MATRVVRVGGVEEPFNLPWIRAFEAGAFADLGVEVTFSEFDGGTGALVNALEDGAIDIATLLTEGAVTAAARGREILLHAAWTDSPLRWGIHVAGDSSAAELADLEGGRFAISRFGSGSELMAYVLADQQGWTLDESNFVVVGGIDGAVEALPAGTAEIFLWERFVTAPLVDGGVFARVDDLETGWPAFYVAGTSEIVRTERPLLDAVVARALEFAPPLLADVEGTTAEIADRYGMAGDDIASWLDGVAWPGAVDVDRAVLGSTMATMADLGRIDAPVPIDDLIS